MDFTPKKSSTASNLEGTVVLSSSNGPIFVESDVVSLEWGVKGISIGWGEVLSKNVDFQPLTWGNDAILTNSCFFSSWVETETINYIDVVGDLQNKFFPTCKWRQKIGRRVPHNLSSLKRRILRWNCPMNSLEMSWSFHDPRVMITWGEKLSKRSREVWAE